MTKLICTSCNRTFDNIRGLHVHSYIHMGPPISKEELNDLYHLRGMNPVCIGNKLGYTNSTILEWLDKYQIRRRSRAESNALSHIDKSKWAYNGESYYPIPSIALYYFIGAMLGDGGIVCYQKPMGMRYGLQFRVVDKILADTFSDSVQQIGLRPTRYVDLKQPKRNPNWRIVYCVFANSMIFVNWYRSLKLNELKVAIWDREEFIRPFLRGFYEAEGSLYKNNSFHTISITNTNKDLLILYQELLEHLGYHPKLYKDTPRLNCKECFSLKLFRKVEVLNFVKFTGTTKLGTLKEVMPHVATYTAN